MTNIWKFHFVNEAIRVVFIQAFHNLITGERRSLPVSNRELFSSKEGLCCLLAASMNIEIQIAISCFYNMYIYVNNQVRMNLIAINLFQKFLLNDLRKIHVWNRLLHRRNLKFWWAWFWKLLDMAKNKTIGINKTTWSYSISF